jgi:DNA-directed RNA polymerase specialized sigma24 family protein
MSAPGGTLSLTDSRIREGAFDRFNELLAEDRAGYSERLDYFEVRFDGAMAHLRLDARRPAYREESRRAPLALEGEDGAPAEAEWAARAPAPFEVNGIDGFLYRPRLNAAIGALPPLQRTIIEMLRQEIPIDSKEPGVVTIASVLDRSEKTIRTHRDLAWAALRAALTQGDDP